MRKAVRDNALTLAFLALMMAAIVGQAFAGLAAERADLAAHGEPTITLWQYVAGETFGANLLENWQSEFLQFAAFIFLSIWLVQRGSAEAKQPGDEGVEPEKAVPWWRRHSLLLVMISCFTLTWLGQSVMGWREFQQVQREHDEPVVSWGAYLVGPDFWERTLQNWQSEFLAVAAMSIFTVFLREKGSPESKTLEARSGDNEPTYQ